MRLIAVLLAAGVTAACAAASTGPTVTLTTKTAKPKAGAYWPYTVKLTRAGKPAKGTITAQIVDPIGGVHAVQFGRNTKNVTRISFTGTFNDYVIWPQDSIGFPLKFRVIVVSGGVKKVVGTTVTVHR